MATAVKTKDYDLTRRVGFKLKKVTITKIVSEFEVKMGRYTSTEPYKQLIKIK